MKIFSILPILTLLFCSWCWVASPQSNNHTSLPRRRLRAEWFLVDDGWADAVPRNVMFMEVIKDLRVMFDIIGFVQGTGSLIFVFTLLLYRGWSLRCKGKKVGAACSKPKKIIDISRLFLWYYFTGIGTSPLSGKIIRLTWSLCRALHI